MNDNVVIDIRNVKKKYKLGSIGGGTLKGEIQSRIALLRGKEDPNAMITTKNSYNKEFWALKGIDLQIRRGERIGIIGHNGAGKSTLLKVLSRITAPTDGEIEYEGRISSMLEVGTGFHGELTGRENIYLNAAILGMTKEEVDSKIDDIIAFSECKDFIDTPVKRYSSGMYVKLAFSVAAHLDSEIMIMDEVLAVGDMRFQDKCLKKMREIAEKEERTILYVSHNMSTIRKLCDRCVVMSKGKIVFDGDPNEAIQIYLANDASEDGEEYYDGPQRVGEVARLNDVSFVEYEGQDKAILHSDKIDKLQIKVTSYEEVQDAHFRILVRYMDSSVAGTFFTNVISLEKGKQYILDYYLDLGMLPEGWYYLQVVFSKALENGNNKKYSQIDFATQFCINRVNNFCAGLKWNNGWRVNFGTIAPVSVRNREI